MTGTPQDPASQQSDDEPAVQKKGRSRTRGDRLWLALSCVTVLAVVAVLLVFVLPQFGRSGSAPAAEPERGPSEATGTVDEDGFSVAVDGVVVEGPPGVAPDGTGVSVSVETNEPVDLADFTETAFPGVAVELDGDLQPAEPIEITFADVQGRAEEEMGLAVVASGEDGGEELAEANWSGDDLVVSTDHLSWFQPVWVWVDDFSTWLGEQVLIAMDVRSEQPDCFVDGPVLDGQWEFDPVEFDLSWPCAERDDQGRLKVTLSNNSPEVWQIAAETPGGEQLPPSTTDLLGYPLLGLSRAMNGDDSMPLIPNGDVAFRFDDPSGEVELSATLDAASTTARIALIAVDVFLPPTKYKKLLDEAAWAQCAADVGRASFDATTENNSAPDGELVAAMFGCIGTALSAVGDATGALLGAVAALPGALVAQLDGALRTATGRDQYPVTLLQDAEEAALDNLVGTWVGPIDQDFSPPYRAVLEIFAEPDGDLVGTSAYPELNECHGDLDNPRAGGANGAVMLRETITEGTDTCVEVVRIRLTPRGPDRLYYDASGGRATGVLRRLAPGEQPDVSPGGSGGSGGGSSTSWPTESMEGPPALKVWLGANMYAYPEWVACDDDEAWCLVGGEAEHMLVEIDGLTESGFIDVATSDAAGDLADLGVGADSIDQILGAG